LEGDYDAYILQDTVQEASKIISNFLSGTKPSTPEAPKIEGEETENPENEEENVVESHGAQGDFPDADDIEMEILEERSKLKGKKKGPSSTTPTTTPKKISTGTASGKSTEEKKKKRKSTPKKAV